MLWARVRDGVLARVREGGRQVALALAEALRDRVAKGRVVLVVGSWRTVFGALGVPEPRCAKTAIRALAMLADLAAGAVQRLGARGHRWWVSSAGDPQLGLDLRDRKPESGPAGPAPAHQPAPPAPRTPARTLALDLAQRSLAAAELAARVTETGALERHEAWAVTMTVPEGEDASAASAAAAKFCEALAAAGGGAVLVPEVAGQLHCHGVAVGSAEQVAEALRVSGAGRSEVSEIGDLRRWTGYCCKRWTGEEIASGVLAGGSDGGGREADGAGDRGVGVAAGVERPAARPHRGNGQRQDDERGGAGGATRGRAVDEGAARPRAASWARRALGAAWRWATGR